MEEVRPFLTAFASLAPPSRARLRLLEVPGVEGAGKRSAEPWESRLREEFISRFGPPLLPLPASLGYPLADGGGRLSHPTTSAC